MTPAFVTRLARDPHELAAYFALRRRVFCDEQRLFCDSDRDERDASAFPIVALAAAAGRPQVAGVVRIYAGEDAVWYGGRLAVDPELRGSARLYRALVACAVSSAHAWGARRFLARVQARNAALFERLHFRTLERCSVRGAAHVLMEADLARYPAAAGLRRDDDASEWSCSAAV